MKRNTLNIILYSISALLLLGGVALLIRQYVLIPGDYTPPPVQTLAPTPSPTPTASLLPEYTPAPTPSPTPYVKVAPVRIFFLDAEIMADIYPVGQILEGERKGQMDTIDDPDVAAWYEPGFAPGDVGNALINGHKSWKGKVGKFTVLWDMEIGQQVAIEREDGAVLYFAVSSVDFYPYDQVPEKVMSFQSDVPQITLITCYGEFDSTAGTSKERCVVVCQLITERNDEQPA